MKTYRVTETCWGFKRRYWEKDQEVTLEDNEVPPDGLFVLIDSKPEDLSASKDNGNLTGEEPTSFSQIQARNKASQTKGFAASLNGEVPISSDSKPSKSKK